MLMSGKEKPELAIEEIRQRTLAARQEHNRTLRKLDSGPSAS